MRLLIISTMLFISFSGTSPQQLESEISMAWKNDSNGCSGDRWKYLDSITNNIIGVDKQHIQSVLGDPNYKTQSGSYVYFVLSDCQDSIITSIILRLQFKNEKVIFYERRHTCC